MSTVHVPKWLKSSWSPQRMAENQCRPSNKLQTADKIVAFPRYTVLNAQSAVVVERIPRAGIEPTNRTSAVWHVASESLNNLAFITRMPRRFLLLDAQNHSLWQIRKYKDKTKQKNLNYATRLEGGESDRWGRRINYVCALFFKTNSYFFSVPNASLGGSGHRRYSS